MGWSRNEIEPQLAGAAETRKISGKTYTVQLTHQRAENIMERVSEDGGELVEVGNSSR